MKILLFAGLRDRLGSASIELAPPCASVADLRVRLAERYPSIASMLPMCAVAVAGEYADDGASLHDGDEIALIPPVSGGSR